MGNESGRRWVRLAAAAAAAAGLPGLAGAQTLSLTTVDTCYAAGETTVTVAVDLTGAPVDVVGGQFFLGYDASVLEFVSAVPGDPPFDFEIHESPAMPAGTLDYAAGVDPTINPPPPGAMSGRMAVLTFSVIGEACDAAGLVSFRAHDPATKLTDGSGTDLAPALADLPAVTLDATPPVVSAPADLTLECDEDTSPAGAAGQATALDGCDGAPAVGFSDTIVPGACDHAFAIMREWTATDACGNSSSATQTITVVDTTAPVVTAPADTTVPCGGDTSPAATGMPTTSDCDAAPTITHSDSTAPGSCPQESVITRTWTATDACGNAGMAVQTITVVDTAGPMVTPPADASVECGADTSPTALGTASAVDNCDGAPVISFSDASDMMGCPETITRTWTATDACGNVGTAVQTITITDSTDPTLTPPADTTIECGDDTTPANTGDATATDNCGTPTIGFSDVVAAGACPNVEIITRTWTATDACGNSVSADQTITIADTTAPVVTAPADITVECGDDTTPTGTGSATATDACDAAPVISHSDSMASGCGGTTVITRTWTATDACGNEGAAVQTITVEDTTAPTFDEPCPLPDVTVVADAGFCTASAASVGLTAPAASDGCGSATVTGERSDGLPMGDPFPSSAPVTVTWTATDGCGNTATCDQLVTVRPVNQVMVDIDLESGFAAGPFTRCIRFRFAQCAPTLSVSVVEAPVTFTSGSGSVVVEVPCGSYVCATAQDPLHTLRRTDEDDFGTNPIVGAFYAADFTAAAGDDDRLVGGNLNNDLVVDILDFGAFIGRFGLSDPANTACPPTGTNADIDGDGAVFVEDFNFIFVNFLETSEANCCGQPGVIAPVERISVAELIATGQGHLAVADLNNDGWLDVDDITAYLNGALPICSADFNGDHVLNVFDLLDYLDAWFAGSTRADMNADDVIDNFDLLGYLDLWFAGC